MRAAAPLLLLEPAGIHVEVLNWTAVAAAVHTRATHPPLVPSPFPYLPATPQELLRAYLEVVGVRPEDSYSAQATVDRVRALGGAHTHAGPKQPCADGKDRMRVHGCEHVVFVYRDRPEYVAGRARWAAYQAEQLQAALERGTGVRRRVESGGMLGRFARAAGRARAPALRELVRRVRGAADPVPLLLAADPVIGDYVPVGHPMRRKRGWFRVVFGLAMLFLGALAVVLGIAGAISARADIEDEAVARAPLGQPTSFEGAAGVRYTVYVISRRADVIVGRTGCQASGGARFSGARQGTSVTLGNASSVGRFDGRAGTIDIVCAGPTTDDYVVTPGGTGILRSILMIIAGAFVALGGIALVIWGLIGRRVPA